MFLNRHFLIFLACFLASSPLFNCGPVDQNELKENEYEGLLTKPISASVTRFYIGLIQKLSEEAKPETNILTSPVNAYAALYLLHLAAGDETRNKLNDILKLHENKVDVSKMHETFSEIYKKMEHTSPHPEFADTETIFANGIFVHKDFPVLDSFVESLRKYYSANVTNLDFAAHSEEATDSINSYVSENTRQRIKKFYKDPLPPNTIAVLANALYFKGQWENPFSVEKTKPEKFNTGTVEMDVPMMHRKDKLLYMHSDKLNFEGIELKYKGDEYTMLIHLPRPGQTLKNLTRHLHLIDVDEISRNSKTVGVDYKIPRMKLSWESSLVHPLQLEDIFRNTDLSRMTTQQGATISDMKQVTEMDVDEHGTVATAATAMSLSRKFNEPLSEDELVKFHVTKPFLVSIIHAPTQMILFSGSIYKPIQS